MTPNAKPSPTIRSPITASHILHHYSILDVYGYISLRNPINRLTFFLSLVVLSMISSVDDIDEHRVEDGEAVEDAEDGGKEKGWEKGVSIRSGLFIVRL